MVRHCILIKALLKQGLMQDIVVELQDLVEEQHGYTRKPTK